MTHIGKSSYKNPYKFRKNIAHQYSTHLLLYTDNQYILKIRISLHGRPIVRIDKFHIDVYIYFICMITSVVISLKTF